MSFFQPAPGTVLSHDIADYPDGIVLPIDKPWRWTSADVIRKVKFAAFRHFRKKNLKVGHAGTLDPLATGVLLVCLGPACKRAQEFQDHDKEYVAGIRFGATTPSYDLEKEVDRTFPYDQVTEEAVRAVLPSFLGPQEQVAPLFSAKSVDGVRAYEMARKLYRNAQKGILDPDFDAAALETLAALDCEAASALAAGRPFPATFGLRTRHAEGTVSFGDVPGQALVRGPFSGPRFVPVAYDPVSGLCPTLRGAAGLLDVKSVETTYEHW